MWFTWVPALERGDLRRLVRALLGRSLASSLADGGDSLESRTNDREYE